ncbi:MAG TPA: SDR family NAD(P)-dependent oxidoreductase [Candidatus Tectomicrobia bacterium]|nr:SDR family NAD(P)-dependent oxidoreductase [Candidatus Tectomicrobia bacterium]
MDLGLTNKVAIITGGSEGIGKAAAHRMAEEGARVVIVARRPDVLEAAAKEIEAATNGVVLPLQGDVSEPATVSRVVKTTLDHFGRIDILVNNAGVSMAKPFEAVSDEDWESDFSLKVWGAVRFIRAVIPEMRKVGGGRIINVTNLGGRTPGPASMPTSISRAAGIAITKGLSKDLAKDNILVNTVCIGLIKSGQHERRYARQKQSNPNLTLNEVYAESVRGRGVPLGRVGEAHEAGDVITFLASERASYLTGVAINIDGGTSAVV